MYRITYTQGNGYHCSCCRNTDTYTHDCATREEVISWLSELEAQKLFAKISRNRDIFPLEDRSIDEIREIKDEDITSEFSADPIQTNILFENWKRELEEEKMREEAEQEDKNRGLLRALKATYEPGLTQR